MTAGEPAPSSPPTQDAPGASDPSAAARLATAERQVEQLSRQLKLAQGFGRIAIVERDLRTGDGQWSAQAYRLYGFDPSGGPPRFEDVAAQDIVAPVRDVGRADKDMRDDRAGVVDQDKVARIGKRG